MKLVALLSTFFLLMGSILAKDYAKKSTMAYLKQVGAKRLAVVRTGNSEEVISDESLDAYHPEMSPLGDTVAFSEGIIDPGKKVAIQLMVKNLKTGTLEEWTSRANQYIHAEFSGSGRYLVFSGPNPKTKKQNIGIIDLKMERQKGPTKIGRRNGLLVKTYSPKITYIDSVYDCYAPAVSSQGNIIVYHRTLDSTTKLSPKELVLFDRETKKKKLISEPQGHAMFPSLSSDDRHVAFVSKRADQWDIHRIDTWTGKESQITDDQNIEFTPVFAPDDSVYFTRFNKGTLGGPSEIGIYKLTKNQVFNSQRRGQPQVFLDKTGTAEYVPSFSGLNKVTVGSLMSFPKPERSSFGAITYGDKVYIVGGHQGPEHTYPEESFLDRMDIYDQKTGTWSQGASMNIPKHGFEMAAHNGYIYVFGGFAFSADHNPGWKSLNTIERYDIKNDRWEVLPAKLPRSRSSNVAVKVDSLVYLIGGWDSTPKHDGDKEGEFHRAIDVFNLETETAQTSSLTLPSPLRRAFNAAERNGKIYLLGGISEGASHFDWIDNVTVLDTNTMTWSEETKLPYATFAPGAGFIGENLYFIGGMVLKNAATYDLNYVDDVYQYNLSSGKWTHIGQYLKENKGFPQVVNLNKRTLGILGGHTYKKDEQGRIIDHPVDSFDILIEK